MRAFLLKQFVLNTTKDHVSILHESHHFIFVSIPVLHPFIGRICFWAIYPQTQSLRLASQHSICTHRE